MLIVLPPGMHAGKRITAGGKTAGSSGSRETTLR